MSRLRPYEKPGIERELMSAAAAAGGLAAGLAFNADRASGIDVIGGAGAVLAVAGFVGVVLATVMIWTPTEGRFVHDSGVIIGSYVEGDPPLDLPERHRELALWLGQQTESNRQMLETVDDVQVGPGHRPCRGPRYRHWARRCHPRDPTCTRPSTR